MLQIDSFTMKIMYDQNSNPPFHLHGNFQFLPKTRWLAEALYKAANNIMFSVNICQVTESFLMRNVLIPAKTWESGTFVAYMQILWQEGLLFHWWTNLLYKLTHILWLLGQKNQQLLFCWCLAMIVAVVAFSLTIPCFLMLVTTTLDSKDV